MGLYPPLRGLSLCAGAGGLDLGLMLAEPGFDAACFVEWEPDAQAALIRAQRAGIFSPAPIWGDLTTFDGTEWRGAVDCVLAGYPCQPFSAAGQRKGADDERHLWPDVARVIGEVGPRWVFLENVAGHLSLGLDTVLRGLRRLGYTSASMPCSAAETGAAHERLRVFVVAYRDGEGREAGHARPERSRRNESGRSGGALADADGGDAGAEREQRGGEQRFQPEGGRAGGGALGNPSRLGWGEGRPEHGVRGGRDAASSAGVPVGDACLPRPQGREQRGACGERAGPGAHGSASEPGRARLPLAPPGPHDRDGWAAVLDLAPDLAPALSLGDVSRIAGLYAQDVAQGRMAEAEAQSRLRALAHELSTRSRLLRIFGNGVHPLTAAHAWRSLSASLGLRPISFDGESQ